MAKVFIINDNSVTCGSNTVSSLGTSAIKWSSGWFGGTVTMGTASVSGAVIGGSGSFTGLVTVGTISASGAVIGGSGSFTALVTVGTLSASGALIAIGSSTFGGILITDNRNVTLGTGTGTTFATATNQKLAFYGAVAVAQQSVLTANVGTVTFSEPTTPDYAIADLTNIGPYGFVSADEGQSLLKVVANLQTRVNELSARLVSYGLLSA